MKKSIIVIATLAIATFAIVLGSVSCKGRTMKNMEALGETVEVMPYQTPELQEDTIENLSDSVDGGMGSNEVAI